MTKNAEFSGPIRPTPADLPKVIAFSNKVFRTDRAGDMSKEFPQLFGENYTDNLRIFERDGEPVSLVGMILDDTNVCGCPLRVASIGSVCSDPICRGKGLAGKLMDEAVARATDIGASLMLISGEQTIYTKRGAWPEGKFRKYHLRAGELPARDAGLTVTPLAPSQYKQALKMFEYEPIHFLRTEAEFAMQVDNKFSQDRPAETYLVSRDEAPVAVVTASMFDLAGEDETPVLKIVEFAGARSAVAASLGEIAKQWQADLVDIEAYEADVAMAEALSPTKAEIETVSFNGTLKILSAERMWQDFAALISERIGPEVFEQITISSESDDLKIHTLTFDRDGESVTIEGDRKIVAALVGSTTLDPLAGQTGELAELLKLALPLPIPLYGMSYV